MAASEDKIDITPSQSTTKIMNAMDITLTTIWASVDLTYGTAGIAHNVVGAMGTPLATLGFENSIFSTLPYVSIGFAGWELLIHAYDFLSLLTTKEWLIWQRISNALLLASTYNVLSVAYANKAQLMSIGSTAFGLLCDALALQALTFFIISIGNYFEIKCNEQLHYDDNDEMTFNQERYDNELKLAKLNIMHSTVNLIIWGALALSHLPALAAITPVLIAIGSIGLIGQGLHIGYAVVSHLTQHPPDLDRKPLSP
jgi:hypothetical protein